VSAAARLWACEAVVYDLDGTLVDTLDDLTEALNAALRDHGLPPVARELVRDSMHVGFDGSVEAALGRTRLAAGRRTLLEAAYRRHYAGRLASGSRPFDGVPELLDLQRERGVRLAVCTNRDEDLAEAVLVSAGLRGHFDVVVGRRADRPAKPDPAPLRLALALLQAPASATVLVGDSAVDVACAAAAALDCLVFTGGYGGAGVAALDPALRIRSYRSLLRRMPVSEAPR
jgi:phosphoglycolate phosphatase